MAELGTWALPETLMQLCSTGTPRRLCPCARWEGMEDFCAPVGRSWGLRWCPGPFSWAGDSTTRFFTPGVKLLKYLETSSGHRLLFLMGSWTTRAEKTQLQLNNGAFIDICSQGASTGVELQLGLLVYQPPSSGSRQSCLLFGVRAACRGQLRRGRNVPVSPPHPWVNPARGDGSRDVGAISGGKRG